MKPGQIMARLKAPLGLPLMAGHDAAARAEAEARDEAEAPRPRRESKRRARRGSITAHTAFVPLVALWGAALFGLAVLVLPTAATARAALLTGLDALGGMAHPAISALAALGGGALAFGIARALSRTAKARAGGPSIIRSYRRKASSATQVTDPINPREELGSESLDAPLEEMPLGIEAGDWLEAAESAHAPAEEGEAHPESAPEEAPEEAPKSVAAALRRRLARVKGEAGTPDAAMETATEPGHVVHEADSAPGLAADARPAEPRSVAPETGEPETGESAPREAEKAPPALDLAGFAALPGRNAVWVEGPLPGELAGPDGAQAATPRTPSPESPAESPTGPATVSAAIARLRATPAEDLSLVQMVERLAAALHERQGADAARPRAAGAGADAEREAALAEALKALGDLAGARSQAPAGPGEAGELAAALARLHDMRGAA